MNKFWFSLAFAMTFAFAGQAQYQARTTTKNNGTGTYYGPRDDNRYELPQRRTASMTDRQFNQILQQMQHSRFDSDREHLGRYLTSQFHFSTTQISSLAATYNFESGRLSFLKDAYATCIDKQNYYRLSKVFRFSSSKDALYAFLNGKR